MTQHFQLQFGQRTAMTPQLLQSIRLLQLSSPELEHELRQALEKNVMLEADEDADEDDGGESDAGNPSPVDVGDDSQEVSVTGCDVSACERMDADIEWSSADSWSGGASPADDGESFEARCEAPVTGDIRVQAAAQLELVLRTDREARIAAALLEAIDDNGYLETGLDQVQSLLGPAFDASLDELEAVLVTVQGVEPSGFGARDLRECLLLQLADLSAETPHKDLARVLVSEHLDVLASNELPSLRDRLGVSPEAMYAAVGVVMSLNPKPGAASSSPVQAVVPDVIVSGRPGHWKVALTRGSLPRVRVNGTYERMLGQSGTHRGLRDQLQEARWLVRGVEMRHDTLLRTSRAIFERQQRFLACGEEGLVSLTLREIAEMIGMHESTVCRVTTNKYVQTPWGVYELKDFFPSQVTGAEAETSGAAVKAMIRRIIDSESRGAPLCDGAIAALLLRNGIRVARRTIAKYREGMKIPPMTERRAAKLPRMLARLNA